MPGDPLESEGPPTAEAICAALDDPDCREIIRTLDEPMTAAELIDQCEIPQSTLYRKLELLTDATLLSESTAIRRDGHHASKYAVGFEEITFHRGENGTLEVDVERPARTAEERLADLWSEVRKET